jgi:fibronectin type 3 domain-containing protein
MLRMAGLRKVLIGAACALGVACGGGNGDDGGTAPPPGGSNPPPTSGGTVDTTPPTVPGEFAAEASSPSQVQLSWEASTDEETGVAGYRLYRDGSNEPIANVTVTHYTDTGLASNTTFVYTLRAYDAASPANESALTEAVSVTTPSAPPTGDSTPPTVPQDVDAIATSTTSIQVSWSPSTDASGIAQYRVFREGTSVPIAATQNTTFTDTQLQPNTTYTYFVTAVDGATPSNESARSDPASATTGPGTEPRDTTPPTVPQNLRADARSSTTIRLRWERSRDQSGIAEYHVFRNGGTAPVGVTDDNEFLDTDLAANTTYQYTVTAIDRADPPNESAHSEAVSATTDSVGPGPGPGDIIPPAPPENLVATARSSTEIDLAWSPSNDPSGIGNYTVFRDGAPEPVATVQTTNYTDGGLEPGSTHTYTVRATDNAAAPNTSAESAPASARTNDAPLLDFEPPTVPQNLMAVTQGSTSIELHWDASTDASGILEYRVYRTGGGPGGGPGPGPGPGGERDLIATVATTSFVDTELEPNTRYTYRVRAVDRALIPNVSDASDPARATTLP